VRNRLAVFGPVHPRSLSLPVSLGALCVQASYNWLHAWCPANQGFEASAYEDHIEAQHFKCLKREINQPHVAAPPRLPHSSRDAEGCDVT
jgi:hypothetical protein